LNLKTWKGVFIMKQPKWLRIVVAVITALLLGVGLQGDSLPAMASPDPAPADAPLLLGSGGVFSIAGTSFVPMHEDIDYDYEGWGGVSLASASSPLCMTASVELPSGATITSLTFYWEDTNASVMRLYLRRYPGDGTFDELAQVSSSGSGGFDSSSTTTISYAEVDNVTYAYSLQLCWNVTSGDDLAAYGAQITYSGGAATATADLTLLSEDAPPSSVEYLPSPDSQATATGGAESSSEKIQIPEEGPVLHTGGEIVELASSSSDVGPLWGETDWQYYSVAASNFHPIYADTVHLFVPGGGRYVTSGTFPSLVVPLDLPHGATIEQAKITYRDNATQNASFYIYQADRQGAGSYVWSDTPERQSSDIVAYNSPTLGETVDNQNYAYYFIARLDPTAMSSLTLYEVAIGYTAGRDVYLPIILKNH
jgi:hypothetical protein